MSWLFSQELVGAYLGDICLDGEQSVQLNGKPTQQAYLSQDKMTKYSRLSRFGMMFKPLTENLGEELLMLYLGDFHAKTSQQLEKEEELKPKEVECGERWQGLLARLDPNTHLWKIPQCSLLEDSEQSLEIWPRWGTMQNGVCWEQPMLVQTIKETEFGLLPNNETFFHTPNTTGLDGGSNSRKALKKRMGLIPTPDANMANRGTQKTWLPIRPSGQPAQYPLNQYLRDLTKTTGKPNPIWCEWLMGWPMEWTDLKPLEMDKSHFVLQQLGQS